LGGILGLVHTLVGQSVHLRGRPWLYYVYVHRSAHLIPLRHDLFGFANYTGLISSLILLLLLATSNDVSLRALGTPQWKQLQRWNYLAAAPAGAHAIAYQVIEKQQIPFVVVVASTIIGTLVLQTAGLERRRLSRMKTREPA
jgi:sulfoxide reductase heme-binding subunit YedZ